MNKLRKLFSIGFLIGMLAVFSIRTEHSSQGKSGLFGKTNEENVFRLIASKLMTKENDFALKSENNFISSAYAESLDIPAHSYVALDFATGEILEEKNSSKQISIASLTKIMTAVVALDLASPDELFTYSDNALSQPATRLAFSPGDKLTLVELLNATLIASANDCAEAIKEGIDSKYGGEVFVRAMNEKAKFLGLKSSHFDNPQGFDSRKNFSSAQDLAILSHYALTHYPLIAQIVAMEYGELSPTAYHQRYEYLNNWNGLLGVYPGVFGVKIGNTDDAGATMIVGAERENKKVLAVLLGAPGVLERDLSAADLLDTGFAKLGLEKIGVTEVSLQEKYSTWKYSN
ncbi:MAG: serine hydrolase [bacterium]|nr:serine hydrolase [bacterium]